MKHYRYSQNVGRARHVVSYHDGVKTHEDGSAFYDVAIFTSARKAKSFMKLLHSQGYAS